MSQTESFKMNQMLSLASILGAILIFAVILYVAYLPARPSKVDQEVHEERKQKADEARASGLAKIKGYEIINEETGTARIPVEEAMKLTVMQYNASVGTSY